MQLIMYVRRDEQKLNGSNAVSELCSFCVMY